MERLHDYSVDAHATARRVRWHQLVDTMPTVRAICHKPDKNASGGFGTPAGWTRVCACGKTERSLKAMRAHIAEANRREQEKHPEAHLPQHRLAGAEQTDEGRTYICSCGARFYLLDKLAEHRTEAQWNSI